jgi:AcrR family transcriptional regulator
MSLLWRSQRKATRGPKPGLTVETIAAKAIELADAEGLPALSMRRVADALGVAPMSLYTYVPSKAELIDVMLDAVYGETAERLGRVAAAATTSGLPAWRAGLEARARADWALYERHPWVLQVSRARALLGPNEIAVYETSLGMVDGLGLTAREMVAVVDVIAGFVGGAAAGVAQAARAPEETGQTDDEWWGSREPILDELWDAERFPTITAVQEGGGFDVPDDSAPYNVRFAIDDFEFGLERLLDGIEAFVARRAERVNGAHGPAAPD